MPNAINPRDVHIAVVLEDGTECSVRRRNPHHVAWDMYASKLGLDSKSLPMMGLTYQAWHALRATTPLPKFDQWADTVDEVYLAAPDGARLVVREGQLCHPDDGATVDDEAEPDPTQPARASGSY